MALHTEITLLSERHDRKAFSCGSESLDRYLHTQAGQDIRRDGAAVYVMTELEGREIIGFYTLSSHSVKLQEFPDDLRKHLPRYETLPTTLIGRLAIDERYKGQKLGERLLLDALKRCAIQSKSIAALAVIVDAIDDKAAEFYHRYDFQPFPTLPLKLFIRMKLVDSLFKKP